MSLGEFDLIERYFWRPAGQGPRRAIVGNGDDCAVIAPASGMQLAISTDTLVEGRHFLSTVDPVRLGHKALAVNLSDLAACGAQPLAFTLALTLPRVDEAWLAGFAQGLLRLADAHECELIGGDTTSGPLAVGITVMGEVPAGQALLRSGACAGDEIWVSGQLGMAWLALQGFRGNLQPPLSGDDFERARRALECPQPRVALGLALRGVASAVIDVSDGFLGDLGHVLRKSRVGARLNLEAFALHPVLALRPEAERWAGVLAGGDDYELAFTAPASQHERLRQLSQALALPLSCVGVIESEPGVRLLKEGQSVTHRWTSFDHFKGGA